MKTEYICPECGSEEYAIEQRYVVEKLDYEYTFVCLHCGYRVSSLGSYGKINHEIKKRIERRSD